MSVAVQSTCMTFCYGRGNIDKEALFFQSDLFLPAHFRCRGFVVAPGHTP